MLFLLPPLFSFAFLILKRRRRRTGPFLLFLHILVLILFGLRLQGREKRTRRRGKLGKRIFASLPSLFFLSPSAFQLGEQIGLDHGGSFFSLLVRGACRFLQERGPRNRHPQQRNTQVKTCSRSRSQTWPIFGENIHSQGGALEHSDYRLGEPVQIYVGLTKQSPPCTVTELILNAVAKYWVISCSEAKSIACKLVRPEARRHSLPICQRNHWKILPFFLSGQKVDRKTESESGRQSFVCC